MCGSKLSTMQKSIISFLVAILFSSSLFAQLKTEPNITDSKGKRQGRWSEADAIYFTKGNYTNSEKDGAWLTYFVDVGILYKVEHFNMGKKDGIFLEFTKRANLLSEAYYINDVMEGIQRTFSQSGLPLTENNYTNGLMDGFQVTYYENTFNKKSEEANYKNGVKHGISKWYDMDGNMIAEYNYAEGKLEGEQKSFYPQNNIRSTDAFVNNQNHGASIEYYENGQVKVSGQYVKGEKEGKWTSYDETGKVTGVQTFNKGKEK